MNQPMIDVVPPARTPALATDVTDKQMKQFQGYYAQQAALVTEKNAQVAALNAEKGGVERQYRADFAALKAEFGENVLGGVIPQAIVVKQGISGIGPRAEEGDFNARALKLVETKDAALRVIDARIQAAIRDFQRKLGVLRQQYSIPVNAPC